MDGLVRYGCGGVGGVGGGGVFFFNDTATTEIYTLSLHDALPILKSAGAAATRNGQYKKRGAAATRIGQYKKRRRCRNEKWAV